ncbi:MAG: winged helix-turn-helix domain-containing protein [Enterobacter roggenkampii]
MSTSYEIDGKIIYDPERHSLSRKDQDEEIFLAVPASYCLLIFLQNHGRLVEKKDLLTKVWDNKGRRVETNTLYQNISLLRKSLTAIGGHNEYIKTVPRHGFMIPAEFAVSVLNDISEIVTETPEEKHTPQMDTDNRNYGLFFLNIGNLKFSYYLFIFVCILLLIFMKFSLSFKRNTGLYSPVNEFSQCHLMKNSDLPSEEIISFIKKNIPLCNMDDFVYFTKLNPSHRISVISCNGPMDNTKTTSCKSYYFKELP